MSAFLKSNPDFIPVDDEGYQATRNELTGSWFGEAIAMALIDGAHDSEIHEILTKVRLCNRITYSRC